MKKTRPLSISILALIVGAVSPSWAQTGDERALFAYLKVQPGTEQTFLAASKDVIRKSRHEPGCLIYILHESEKDPQQFIFYELYKSDADLQMHRKLKHVVDFLRVVSPILVPGGFTLKEFVAK